MDQSQDQQSSAQQNTGELVISHTEPTVITPSNSVSPSSNLASTQDTSLQSAGFSPVPGDAQVGTQSELSQAPASFREKLAARQQDPAIQPPPVPSANQDTATQQLNNVDTAQVSVTSASMPTTTPDMSYAEQSSALPQDTSALQQQISEQVQNHPLFRNTASVQNGHSDITTQNTATPPTSIAAPSAANVDNQPEEQNAGKQPSLIKPIIFGVLGALVLIGGFLLYLFL
jgi:hypothetical protein